MLSSLEFHKVKEQITAHAASSLGREKLLRLKPLTDLSDIQKQLDEVEEASAVMRLRGHAPFGGLTDIRSALRRAEIGSVLTPAEFTELSGPLYAVKQMKHFISQMTEDGVGIPLIQAHAEELITLGDLEREINSCIDDHGKCLIMRLPL